MYELVEKPRIIIRKDSREQKGWTFKSYPNVEVVTKKLDVADYALDIAPQGLVIERKGEELSEIYQNCSPRLVNGKKQSSRFVAELDKLLEVQYPFLILEFTADELYEQPYFSKLNPAFVWSFLLDYQLKGIGIIFAGNRGEDICVKLLTKYAKLLEAQKCV